MPISISTLDELIALRAQERDQNQKDYTRTMTETADAALGDRVVDAIDPTREGGWELTNTSAYRKFIFRKGEFHLVVNAILGANRVEVELRHADMRFTPLAKKVPIQDLDEDWFLNAIEVLAAQIHDRLKNPRNFV